jgi:dolichol-phosphate mannosyltransferase
MKSLVIIPTYNERENIEAITAEVLRVTSEASAGLDPADETHILVVDDNSPDGTGEIARGLAEREPRLHVLSRPGKQGLGKAYIAAFKWGLDRGYDAFVEMDADFSHRPLDLVKIIKAAQSNDFVIGSRYVAGGTTVNWGLGRKIISRGGSLYSRLILGYPLRDWTGGFNAWRRHVLLGIDLDSLRSEGYSFQIELKFRSLRAGFKPIEVPIVFEDRRVGMSKMTMRIVVEAFGRVWGLRFG